MKNNIVEKNYFYSLVYQIVSIGASLFMMPYIARVVGDVGIGIYSYTTSVSYYVTFIGALGISLYGQREISALQNNLKKKNKTFLEIYVIKLIVMSITFLLYCFLLCNSSNEYSFFFKLLIIEVVAHAIDITWYYQGIENFRRVLIKNLINKILTVVLILLFVKSSDHLWRYVFIYGLSTFVSNVSLYIKLNLGSITKYKLNLKRHIKPILVLFLPQLAISLYSFLDKLMIGWFIPDIRNVGFYDQTHKIICMLLLFVTSFGSVMLSRLSNYKATNKDSSIVELVYKSFNYIWFIIVPITLGIVAVADNLIPWFLGEQFLVVAKYLKCFAIIIMFSGLFNVIGEQYLVVLKREKEYTFILFVSSILNIVFNIPLILLWGVLGAIISSIISESVRLLLGIFIVRKEIDFKNVLSMSRNYIIAGIVMFIVVKMISLILSSSIINTVILAIIGFVIYGGILFVVKDKLLISIIDNFTNKRS